MTTYILTYNGKLYSYECDIESLELFHLEMSALRLKFIKVKCLTYFNEFLLNLEYAETIVKA